MIKKDKSGKEEREVGHLDKIFSAKKLSDSLSSNFKNQDFKIEAPKPGFFNKIFAWLMRHFFITFMLLYLTTTFTIVSYHPIWSIAVGVLMISYVTIYLSRTIRMNIHKFMNNQLQIRQIITGYVSTILAFIGLFALLYWGTSLLGNGYIKYGTCNANIVTTDMIQNDPGLVVDTLSYVYFSAMTFLTVGYGDICAMGSSKIVSIIEALVGNIFTLLILAIAISNYNSKKYNQISEKNNDK